MTEAEDWYGELLKSVERRDIVYYGSFLAANCQMAINHRPSVVGKGEVLHSIAEYWQAYDSVKHILVHVTGEALHFSAHTINQYQRYDGTIVSVHAETIVDRNASGLATSFRLTFDELLLYGDVRT